MSLINKMLQDLDARGTPPGEGVSSQLKPVAREPQGPNLRVVAAAVIGACAGLALAWYGWGHFHASSPAVAPVVAKPQPAKVAPGMKSTITMLPAAPAPAPASAAQVSEGPAAVIAEPEVQAETPPAAPARTAAAPAKRRAADADAVTAKPAPRKSVAAAAAAAADAAPKSVVPVEPDSEEARAVRRALSHELEARQARKPAVKAKPAAAGVEGREQSVSQRAEGEYRHALAAMQDGRMGETIAALESALRIDPGHEAARQTLVGLFIEAKRPEDAIRQLQLGLTQDPRQPALAMLLARLQIERGGSGIETLTRTLPYAGANPDYHAFLAGALQRQQRHREAAAEYLAALRGAPANGVWWMGMGISLQAEKRNAEALDAFQKAQASGVLSAELQAFVERQIRQLGR